VDIRAERAVLAYLVLDGNWQSDLTADDFSGDAHKRIYYALDAIEARSETRERAAVAAELSKKKQLASIGGISYLIHLDDETGIHSTSNIRPYIDSLHEYRTLRRIQARLHIELKHLHSGDCNAENLIASGVEFYSGLAVDIAPKNETSPSILMWPDPIHENGFHGVAGDMVRRIAPQTEADPAALLLQFLTAWGSLAGRGPYYLVEADRHHTNIFVAIVGTTSKGRKGTSWGRVQRGVLSTIDEHRVEACLLQGVGSGEALLDSFAEPDRRRLVIEPEFSRLLAIISREGCTLSQIFRTTWDQGTADIRTRQNKLHVTGAHLSLIGHITRDELLRRLSDTRSPTASGTASCGCAPSAATSCPSAANRSISAMCRNG
jgi:hypothetical protein